MSDKEFEERQMKLTKQCAMVNLSMTCLVMPDKLLTNKKSTV